VTSRPSDIAHTRVAVIGAGLMGHSIAGVLAAAGAAVSVYDSQSAALAALPGRVAGQLVQLQRDADIAAAISLEENLARAVAGAHLVIEAVPEDLSLKQDLLAAVGTLVPEAVLATNTSVLRIGEVAAKTARPARVAGTHWFNPPHLVPVVEVVQGPETSRDCIDWLIHILEQAGKMPVHVRKDLPGFIGNRLQHALWREALHLVDDGVCDAATVDKVVRNSFGLRLAAMGPLENADYVGLDLILAVHAYLFPSLCRDSEPANVLQELVARHELGAKTGSGFGEWPPGRREEAAARLDAYLLALIAHGQRDQQGRPGAD
jgi:3-hydroxybutyryl-CoA dehydrogenase